MEKHDDGLYVQNIIENDRPTQQSCGREAVPSTQQSEEARLGINARLPSKRQNAVPPMSP